MTYDSEPSLNTILAELHVLASAMQEEPYSRQPFAAGCITKAKAKIETLASEVNRLETLLGFIMGKVTNAHACLMAGTSIQARQFLCEAMGIDGPLAAMNRNSASEYRYDTKEWDRPTSERVTP